MKDTTSGARVAPVVDVVVEEHPALPDGCEMRFARVGEARVVTTIEYEPLDEGPGLFRVEGRDANDAVVPAHAVEVDDSSAGTSTLIYGGGWGLRLTRVTEDAKTSREPPRLIAEPYLLLDRSAVVR